ncbi:MAG: hypothetical protein D6729_05155, partial [Deltaproteobacteria bacterium]
MLPGGVMRASLAALSLLLAGTATVASAQRRPLTPYDAERQRREAAWMAILDSWDAARQAWERERYDLHRERRELRKIREARANSLEEHGVDIVVRDPVIEVGTPAVAAPPGTAERQEDWRAAEAERLRRRAGAWLEEEATDAPAPMRTNGRGAGPMGPFPERTVV